MTYDTATIADRTGLSAAQVRAILRAYGSLPQYATYSHDQPYVFLGARYSCNDAAYREIFGAIEDAREKERLVDAQRMLVEAQAIVEERRMAAERRTAAARQRLEVSRNAARARRDAFNKQPFKVRRPAAFRLAATPEVRSLREATLLVLAAGDEDA